MTTFPLATPLGRWAGFGPYYAMFPVSFAVDVVRENCPVGGRVLDPFAGRGTSIYAAAAQEREGVGIELNPVGWIYSETKLNPAGESAVLKRLHEIGQLAWDENEVNALPEFFRYCYSPQVLQFLLKVRTGLCWRENRVDRTLMAIILVYLHAKEGAGLSSQMRQSKAMSPPYAIRWWQENKKSPPEFDPIAWLENRIQWRYKPGLPALRQSRVLLADSSQNESHLFDSASLGGLFDLLFTSPPYFAITNYQYDQWLRLWLLGEQPYPVAAQERSRGRHASKAVYRQLLLDVFSNCVPLLCLNATIYVRTDARQFTRETTIAVLGETFPNKQIEIIERPYSKSTQTSLFGDKAKKPGEIDIILKPKRNRR